MRSHALLPALDPVYAFAVELLEQVTRRTEYSQNGVAVDGACQAGRRRQQPLLQSSDGGIDTERVKHRPHNRQRNSVLLATVAGCVETLLQQRLLGGGCRTAQVPVVLEFRSCTDNIPHTLADRTGETIGLQLQAGLLSLRG